MNEKWMTALLRKFPDFDPRWSEICARSWFAMFDRLVRIGIALDEQHPGSEAVELLASIQERMADVTEDGVLEAMQKDRETGVPLSSQRRSENV